MAGYSQKRLLEGVHDGEYSKFNLPRDLFEYTYNLLADEIDKVFDKTPDFPDEGEREAIVKELKTNIAQFSGAKTFTEVNEISRFLFDGEGYKLPFKEFEEIVKPIDDKYNKVWLKTEQDTSFGQSQSADEWLKYEAEADIFPLLKYQTAADERVRHQHAAWDNKVFPVGHEFWDTRMPLNGYNCRCRVIQIRDGRKSSAKGLQKNTDKVFNKNVGKTGEIFTKKHPYFKVPKKDLPLTRDNYGLGMPTESATPEPFKLGGEYVKGTDIKFNNDFFKLLDPEKPINLRFRKRGGSYHQSGKPQTIQIETGGRIERSVWERQAVIYHEYGHGIDHQRGLRAEITNYLNDLRKALNKRQEYTVYRRELKEVDGRWKMVPIRETRKMSRAAYLDYRGKSLNTKFSRMKNETFESRGVSKWDALEQVVSMMDTLMSINPSYGSGHSKAYFKQAGAREAEFLAHAFENTFLGNRVFKKVMPEIYDQTVDFINKLKPKQW